MNLFVADGVRTHAGQDLFLRERRGPRSGFSFGINYNSSAEKVQYRLFVQAYSPLGGFLSLAVGLSRKRIS